MTEKIHHGRAVKRIRELLHIKQDALAIDLGISQQAVSQLENKEMIDPETLEQIAKTMKVPVEAIKNFNEEASINIIANTFTDNQTAIGYTSNYIANFNPIEKWVETLEEVKRLNAALLKEKDEKIALMERLLSAKK